MLENSRVYRLEPDGLKADFVAISTLTEGEYVLGHSMAWEGCDAETRKCTRIDPDLEKPFLTACWTQIHEVRYRAVRPGEALIRLTYRTQGETGESESFYATRYHPLAFQDETGRTFWPVAEELEKYMRGEPAKARRGDIKEWDQAASPYVALVSRAAGIPARSPFRLVSDSEEFSVDLLEAEAVPLKDAPDVPALNGGHPRVFDLSTDSGSYYVRTPNNAEPEEGQLVLTHNKPI